MVLQITSGVGGSAPVNSVTPTLTQSTTSTSSTVLPSYRLDFAGLTRATAVGLSTPTSVGDIEVLFAEIASALNETIGVLTDEQKVTRAETLRGQLGAALAAFSQMAEWGERVDIHRANDKVQQNIVDVQTDVRDTKTLEKQGLEGSRQEKQQTLDGNLLKISGYDTNIGTLTGEKTALELEKSAKTLQKASLDPQKDAATIAELDKRLGEISREISGKDSAIGYWQGLKATLEQDNKTLREDLATLNGRIDTLTKEVNAAKEKISAAEESQKISRQIVTSTLASMEQFIESTILLMNVIAGTIRSDMGRESGQIGVEGQSFDNIVSGLAQAMVEIGATLAQGSRDVDVALHTEGAGLNQGQSVPDRFGALPTPVARAIAFAGMIAGVLGPVRDLLTNLVEGLTMQTAETFAQSNTQRVRVGV